MTPKETSTRSHEAGSQGAPGTELVVDIGPIAHGGHFVARHEGRVIFVRHGIPGEKARIRLTDSGAESRFWRADVVDVLEPSPDRVPHIWTRLKLKVNEAKSAVARPWAALSSGTLPWSGNAHLSPRFSPNS